MPTPRVEPSSSGFRKARVTDQTVEAGAPNGPLLADPDGLISKSIGPSRQVFTWDVGDVPSDGSRVLIDIIPLGTGCDLTLTHELHPDWADYVSRTEAAWTKMLEAIKAATE